MVDPNNGKKVGLREVLLYCLVTAIAAAAGGAGSNAAYSIGDKSQKLACSATELLDQTKNGM